MAYSVAGMRHLWSDIRRAEALLAVEGEGLGVSPQAIPELGAEWWRGNVVHFRVHQHQGEG